METKRKKQLYNGLMIVGIVMFLLIGSISMVTSVHKDLNKETVAENTVEKGSKNDDSHKKLTDEALTMNQGISISGSSIQSEEGTEEKDDLISSGSLDHEMMTEKNADNKQDDGNLSKEDDLTTENKSETQDGSQEEEKKNIEQSSTPTNGHDGDSVSTDTTECPQTSVSIQTPKPIVKTCKITIQCTTILNHMDQLDTAKHTFVPKDGYMLKDYAVEVKSGDVVFDVLKRACDENEIQLEYAFTPIYNSYYIEGINHLYEFDCGNQSGWMYKINDGLPQSGSSSCEVKENDNVVWLYTCEGLGADVGGSVN